jgi:hypothetical protein
VSYDAIKWALAQNVGKSSSKLVLLVMAAYVPEDGPMLCAASYTDIAKCGHMDAKTVEAGVGRLRAAGFITATEARAGATGKIVVFQLNATKNGVITSGQEGGGGAMPQHANATKNGVINPERNDPVFLGNPPKFTSQSPQISGLNPPKTDVLQSLLTTPIEDKKRVPKKVGKGSGEGIRRPDDVAEQTWKDWTALRTKKRAVVSETVIAEARTEAGKAGLTLERFLAIWCLRGSQGLQADWLKPNERGASKPTSRHSGFRETNYLEGMTNGVPDA